MFELIDLRFIGISLQGYNRFYTSNQVDTLKAYKKYFKQLSWFR